MLQSQFKQSPSFTNGRRGRWLSTFACAHQTITGNCHAVWSFLQLGMLGKVRPWSAARASRGRRTLVQGSLGRRSANMSACLVSNSRASPLAEAQTGARCAKVTSAKSCTHMKVLPISATGSTHPADFLHDSAHEHLMTGPELPAAEQLLGYSDHRPACPAHDNAGVSAAVKMRHTSSY